MTSAPPAPAQTTRRSAVRTDLPAPTAFGVLAVVKSHHVLTYYALTFAISWGGFVLVGGPAHFSAANWQADPLFLLAVLVVLAGPSVAGLLLTGLVSGRAGYRELLARLLRWRVGVGWYLVALLTAPLLTAAVLVALSRTSPVYLPGILTTSDKAALLLTGLASALMVGALEELGWTGFAIPRLRVRYSVLATGLIVGSLCGAWHLPLFWEANSFAGTFPLTLLLARLFSWLPAYRVLMAWVYDRTGSLLVAMLMHASLGASQLILMPVALAGVPLLTSIFGWAAVLWVIVVAVVVATNAKLPRPLREEYEK
jgi:membrane protease YdiL (CAAX protease family)